MGAWSTGPFDNDDAGDWLWEFDEADGAEGIDLIRTALAAAMADGYLESGDGAIAVAAAQVVAWIADPTTIDESPDAESATAWIRRAQPEAVDGLAAAAIAAIDRVGGSDSELAELWSEAGEDGWSAELARLRAALDTPA